MASRKQTKSRPGKKPVAPTTSRRGATPAARSHSTTRSPAATITLKSQAVESKPSQVDAESISKAIRDAAYFLWRERGGNEVVNWLEAERLVLANGSEKARKR